MSKNILFILFPILLLVSCYDNGSTKIEKFYRDDLFEKDKLIGQLITERVSFFERYHGYEMGFYYQNQEKLRNFFHNIVFEVLQNANNRQAFFNNYKFQITQLNKYCDSLKRGMIKFFFPADAEKMIFQPLDSATLFSVRDDSLFTQILISNLKSQINMISYASSNYGCVLGTYIDNGNFHDFFIVEAITNDKKYCCINIKNRFLKNVLETDYDITIKSFNKVENNDTIDLTKIIRLKKTNNQYESNDFPVTKGHYFLNFEFMFKNTNGSIKAGELSWDFDIK